MWSSHLPSSPLTISLHTNSACWRIQTTKIFSIGLQDYSNSSSRVHSQCRWLYTQITWETAFRSLKNQHCLINLRLWSKVIGLMVSCRYSQLYYWQICNNTNMTKQNAFKLSLAKPHCPLRLSQWHISWKKHEWKARWVFQFSYMNMFFKKTIQSGINLGGTQKALIVMQSFGYFTAHLSVLRNQSKRYLSERLDPGRQMNWRSLEKMP